MWLHKVNEEGIKFFEPGKETWASGSFDFRVGMVTP
jgi:hypothetical protein